MNSKKFVLLAAPLVFFFSCNKTERLNSDVELLLSREPPVEIKCYEVIQSLQENRSEAKLILYDVLGRKVDSVKLSSERTQLAVELLKTGMASYYTKSKILELKNQPPLQ